MRARRLAASTCVLAAVTSLVAGCGVGGNDGPSKTDETKSVSLTIYSSLPLSGASRGQSISIANGEKLALEAVGGRVGPFTVKFKLLDDSIVKTGRWDPAQSAKNARQAAQDRSAIAYLGDSDSGATAISLPVLNEIGLLQISPASTTVGLTRSKGAEKGEPEKYYPSGKQTFVRLPPADDVQAKVQLVYQAASGCTSIYVLSDGGVYGKRLADQVLADAKDDGVVVAGSATIDPDAEDYVDVAGTVRATRADCIFFGGTIENNAIRLFTDLQNASRDAKLFGGDGVANATFAAKLGKSVARRVYLTSPTLDPESYPASGRSFFRLYSRTFGSEPEPYAIYGYEAMSLALQAIKNAGENGDDKQAVIDAALGIRDRRSVLGKYSVEKSGDITLGQRYGAYRVRDGKLVFDRVIEVPDS